MLRRLPRSTRTDTPFPDTTLFRSVEASIVGARSRGVSTSLDTNGFVLFGATLRLARLIPASAARTAPLTTPRCGWIRSEEHTSELQSLMRISYAVFCLKKKSKTSLLSITDTDQTYDNH